MTTRRICLTALALIASLASGWSNPALYIVGDSTVRNSTAGQQGWGDPLADHFDPAKIKVINRAIGGRSSRTFLTEGRWDAVLANLNAGDFVLMQFGHNNGGKLNDERCRASIRGTGEETEEIVRQTDNQPETVHTYGWYLRKFIADIRAKGATPIMVSLIPRNLWKDGKIGRATEGHGVWAKEVAEQTGTPFIDFNRLLADRYESIGIEKTAALFAGSDHTHTSPAGASFNADVMAAALRPLEIGKHLFPADLWLPSIFSDHMVLQRDMAIPVWGTAAARTDVTVSLAGKTAAVKAGDDGRWKIELPPMPAGGPFTLDVSAGIKRAFSDVMLGEVWLCSGQSNMDFTLASTPKRSFSGVTDWQNELAKADHPRIRSFSADWAMAESPRRDVGDTWNVCTPENAGDFSAAAYYFAVDLEKALDVPVGLVVSAFGASTAEAWIREEKLAAHPQFKGLMDAFAKKRLAFCDDPKPFADFGAAMAKWKSGRKPKNPDPVQDQHNPYVLHNGMIAPLAPYAIRGAIWYQGESNLNTRQLYPDLQKALIEDWREIWKNPVLPFYFVQLAAHKAPSPDPESGQLPEMREAQAKSLSIPNTGMAVTIDIGDEKDVHPRNKLDVGKRLARLALAGTYRKSIVPGGPIFREATLENAAIRVRFDQIGEGLVANDGPLARFAIAGADKKFAWADATIENGSVIVKNPSITEPAFVRYAWANNPAGANLFNSEGLPAAPFRTDP